MVFVTGGTGFLGAHLLMELCGSGKKIRALKRTNSDLDFVRCLFSFYNKSSLFENIEWVEGDILDIHSLFQAMQSVENVYHCAAMVSFSEKDSKKIYKTNVQGTANIVDAALEVGVKSLCHVSSIAVLGNDTIINDETLWDINVKHSAYAKSKYGSELEIWRGVAEGLDTVIVRPSLIIGPWKQNNGIGVLFQKINNGFKYYTSGSNGFVDVRDVAKVMLLLTESPVKNDSFILSSENLLYREIINMIAENTGKPAPSICANHIMTGLAWRYSAVKEFITGKVSGFNRATAFMSQSKSKFSNNKLNDVLSFSYIPIKESIAYNYQFYQFLANINTCIKE